MLKRFYKSLLLCFACFFVFGCNSAANQEAPAPEVENTPEPQMSEEDIEKGEMILIDEDGFLTKEGAISLFPGLWEGTCIEGLDYEFKVNFAMFPDGRFFDYACGTSIYTGKTSCSVSKWFHWDVKEDGTFVTSYSDSWTTKYKYIDDDTLETSYPSGTKFVWNRVSSKASDAPINPDTYEKPEPFNGDNQDESDSVNIGMTEEQVIKVWGYPGKKNITETKYGVHEQWVYRRSDKTKYVYFDNGIVTAIQY